MMMHLPPFGDRKPSGVLAEMLEYCPAGESSAAVFAFLYLQWLPREIRVLFSENDSADMRAIVEKADRLIAMHVSQSYDLCAVVAALDWQEDLRIVAAATQGACRKGKGLKRPQQKTLGRCIDLSRGGFPVHIHVLLPCQVW
jgi:hypothetical protein